MAENEYKLPDVGEGLTEAEMVTWMVKVGDTIKVNDIICEIETAKSLVELPSPYAGTVTRLMVNEGETVAVGTPIIAVSSGAGAAAGPSNDGDKPGNSAPGSLEAEATVARAPSDRAVEPGMVGSPAPNADDSSTPTLVGYGPRTAGTKRRARSGTGAVPTASAALVQSAPVQSAPAAPVSPRPAGRPSESVRALAKPPVRKLARDLGIDLAQVPSTGPNGTISRADVEGFAARGDATSGARPGDEEVGSAGQAAGGMAYQAVRQPGERETRVPIKGVRKMTAQAMVASAFTAPHVTEWTTVDVTRMMKLLGRLRRDRAFADVKVTPLLLVARAVCIAAKRTPEVNSSWDEAAQEIVLKNYVNLGIAAATPRGLIVPNIKDADAMSALTLARAIGELVSTARSGKTQPAEASGGTFTITNVGMFGIDGGTPILNPGEAAILCMGAIRKQPWVVGHGRKSKIRPRWTMTLAMSFDHRIVDGEQGSRFLSDASKILHDPTQALLV